MLQIKYRFFYEKWVIPGITIIVCLLPGITLTQEIPIPHAPMPLADGLHSGIDSQLFVVIQNEAQLDYIWTRHSLDYSPPLKKPTIDFTKWQVIALFLGNSPYCNKKLRISTFSERELFLEVGVSIIVSEPVECAPERPHVFQKIHQSNKPVKFDMSIIRE